MSNVLDQIANTDLESPTVLWTCSDKCVDNKYHYVDHPRVGPGHPLDYRDDKGPCVHCGRITSCFYRQNKEETE